MDKASMLKTIYQNPELSKLALDSVSFAGKNPTVAVGILTGLVSTVGLLGGALGRLSKKKKQR